MESSDNNRWKQTETTSRRMETKIKRNENEMSIGLSHARTERVEWEGSRGRGVEEKKGGSNSIKSRFRVIQL